MLFVIAVSLIVAGVAGAYFRLMGALPIAVTQTQKTSTFDVMGTGKVVVVPDEAIVSMGVQKTGVNVASVQQQVNTTMTDLQNKLKGLGIDAADIKTTAYTFYPDYTTKGTYVANAEVSVKIRDLTKVSPVLDLVGTLGLQNVQGPTFELSDDLQAKTMKSAREIAINEAKKKATELAGLSGMTLGRIVNVQEGNSTPPIYRTTMDLAVPAAGVASKTTTPVAQGSSEVSVNVTLSYETR